MIARNKVGWVWMELFALFFSEFHHHIEKIIFRLKEGIYKSGKHFFFELVFKANCVNITVT